MVKNYERSCFFLKAFVFLSASCNSLSGAEHIWTNLLRKITFILVPALFIYCSVDAQIYRDVKGSVRDSTGSRIIGANVSLVVDRDTLQSSTNDNGIYYFSRITGDTITIVIKSLGFLNYSSSYIFKKTDVNVLLPPVVLKTSPHILEEITVRRAANAVLLKKDTIEYDPDAFTVGEGEMVDALLRQLPGVEVDRDGTVSASGREMSLLRVNGKDFFTGNIKDFVNQLPAEIVEKVQVIDDYGDEANFTGIRTGEPRKVLNVVTKAGMDGGRFGNAGVIAGSNKRYGVNGNANYWKENNQISLSSNLNTSSNVSGVSNFNNASASYADKWGEKITASGAYSYSNNRNNTTGNSYTETVNVLGTIFNTSANENSIKSRNHSISSQLNYDPSDNIYVHASPNFTFSNNHSRLGYFSRQEGVIHQDIETRNRSSKRTPAADGTVSFGHRSEESGRSFTLSVSVNNSDDNSVQEINDKIRYFRNHGQSFIDSVLNRLLTTKNNATRGNIEVLYSEPITKRMNIGLNYSYSATRQRNNLLTFVTDPFGNVGGLVDSLSTIYNNLFTTHVAGANYNYNAEKIRATVGLNVQKNILNGNYEGIDGKIRNESVNFSPQANLNYIISEGNKLGVDYSGNSMAPRYNQLQPVRDTRNLQNITVGNPNLKPSFNHRINIEYNQFVEENQGSLTVRVAGSTTQNQVVNNTVLKKDTLNNLKQETYYENVNGAYSVNGGYSYSLPYKVAGKISRLSFDGNIVYNRGISFADNIKNYSTALTLSQSVRTGIYYKKMNVNSTIRYTRNDNEYSLDFNEGASIDNWQFNVDGSIRFSKKITASLDLSKSINKGYRGVPSNNPMLINTYLRINMFKNNSGRIDIQAYDLLNQGNNLTRTATGNSIVENRTNYISRYLNVSFSMRLSEFGKKSQKDE